MNICLITPAFPLDEEDYRAAFSLDFARVIEKRGHKIIVHTPDREGEKVDLGLDISWFRWSGGHKAIARTRFWHPRDVYDLLSLIRNGTASLLRLIEREKIDACMALWAIPCGVFAYRAFKKRGVPYSVWALGSDIWTYGNVPIFRKIIFTVFRHATRCYADGFDLAKKVERIAQRNCTFLPTSRKLPPPQDDTPNKDEDQTRFLFVGRFDGVKGAETLIEASAVLKEKRDDFTVAIRGEGPLESRLRKRINTLGLSNTVHLSGRLSRQAFSNELKQADALVIPSSMESIPVVMTDALQKGVPVIVSNVGDMGYLVRTFGAGLVFEPGDVRGLANSMNQFMGSKKGYGERIPELVKEIRIERAADIYLRSLKKKHNE